MKRMLLIPAALLLGTLAPAAPANAEPAVVVIATVGDTDTTATSSTAPLRVRPNDSLPIVLTITNNSDEAVDLRSVRLAGKVVGLTFFSYDTSIGLTVAPGATERLAFDVDLGGLKGQAVGLLPATLTIYDKDRHVQSAQDLIVDVRGSLRSVYGLFGLLIMGLTTWFGITTMMAFMANRLPRNRWVRALRFVTPGLGFGLSFIFTLSALRLRAPTAERWFPVMAAAATVSFLAGYLTTTPVAPVDTMVSLEAAQAVGRLHDRMAHADSPNAQPALNDWPAPI